jgi:hypothetical protein
LALAAFAPALFAGWIWNDNHSVWANPTLREASGLARMWTDRYALPQWYPLVHTTFWLEAQVWRGADGQLIPFGFHLDNLLLHA